MKTAYLQKLPWLFAALAHPCEETARRMAVKIKEQWESDPRPEAHHRITAELMQPGLFRDGLEAFLQGAALRDLPLDFQLRVGTFRFVPVVETTIEEKHARVSLAKRRHHIGPVRVSLSNRLPLLERWILRGQVSGQRPGIAITLGARPFSMCETLPFSGLSRELLSASMSSPGRVGSVEGRAGPCPPLPHVGGVRFPVPW